MTEDIKITTDRDIEIDVVGDLATVSGRRRIEQQIATIAGRYSEEVLGEATPEAFARFESRIRRDMNLHEYIDSVVNVSAQLVDDTTIEITVETRSEIYTATV